MTRHKCQRRIFWLGGWLPKFRPDFRWIRSREMNRFSYVFANVVRWVLFRLFSVYKTEKSKNTRFDTLKRCHITWYLYSFMFAMIVK